MKIYFSRHGESQANLTRTISNRDVPHHLTIRGREQAHALGDQLRRQHITHIYSSPVPRSIETSEIVAHQLGLPYKIVEALREYDCGVLEGRGDEYAWQEWQRVFNAWYLDQRYDECLDGGEAFYHIRNRFVTFIEGLEQRYENSASEIVCISHGGIYALMLPLVIKNVNYELMKQFGFDYTFLLETELFPEGLICTRWNGVHVKYDSSGN